MLCTLINTHCNFNVTDFLIKTRLNFILTGFLIKDHNLQCQPESFLDCVVCFSLKSLIDFERPVRGELQEPECNTEYGTKARVINSLGSIQQLHKLHYSPELGLKEVYSLSFNYCYKFVFIYYFYRIYNVNIFYILQFVNLHNIKMIGHKFDWSSVAAEVRRR